jgi:hypothetical protein
LWLHRHWICRIYFLDRWVETPKSRLSTGRDMKPEAMPTGNTDGI